MNKYAARGLMTEAVNGRRVVVLSRDFHACRGAFETFAHEYLAEVTLHRTRGEERITFPRGGSVSFVSVRQRAVLRGLAVDVVFIDDDADRVLATSEISTLHADIRLALISTQGELVRA